mgnify:FL=1
MFFLKNLLTAHFTSLQSNQSQPAGHRNPPQNLEQDAEILGDKVIRATGALKDALKKMKRKNETDVMKSLHQKIIMFFKRLQVMAFKTWSKNVLLMNEANRRRQLQYSCMMKIVAKQNCGMIRYGMAKWKRYREQHRKQQINQARGVKILRKTIGRILLAPQEAGFKHWHRIMMLMKEEAMRLAERDARKNGLTSLDSKHTGKVSSLSDIMSTFHNDVQGGLEVLTRELMRLKDEDLAELRRDWMSERERSSKESSDTLSNALDAIKSRAEQFENQISSKLQLLAQEVPVIKKMLKQESRKVKDLGKKNDDVDMKADKNKANIDSLLLNAGRTETRIFELETELNMSKNELKKTQDGLANSLKLIENLEHRLDDAAVREDELKNRVIAAENKFEFQFKQLKELITDNENKINSVETEVDIERSYVRDMETNVNSDLDEIRKVVFAQGVVRPSLQLMVDACLPFEETSFTKKWCPPINSTDLKIYIPDAIAVFSVDMAAWIAFKADHEALGRVVSGQNPEEMVYADEEIEHRRKFLMQEVKQEWEEMMNTESESPGALRLEARTKFVARLMDSIDSALSKHDQVLITGSSRASRIKASIPTCVACDRPLRTKARKGKLMEEAGAGGEEILKSNLGKPAAFQNSKSEHKKRPMTAGAERTTDPSMGGYVEGRSGGDIDLSSTAAQNNYVMRSGFKFPQKKGALMRSSQSTSTLETTQVIGEFTLSGTRGGGDVNARTNELIENDGNISNKGKGGDWERMSGTKGGKRTRPQSARPKI